MKWNSSKREHIRCIHAALNWPQSSNELSNVRRTCQNESWMNRHKDLLSFELELELYSYGEQFSFSFEAARFCLLNGSQHISCRTVLSVSIKKHVVQLALLNSNKYIRKRVYKCLSIEKTKVEKSKWKWANKSVLTQSKLKRNLIFAPNWKSETFSFLVVSAKWTFSFVLIFLEKRKFRLPQRLFLIFLRFHDFCDSG